MNTANGPELWPGWCTVRLIGRGSFGAVYEIERDMFGEKEKAALKVISIPQNSSDIDELYSAGYSEEQVASTFTGYLKSFVAEYSMMRKLNGCTNVVSCDDVRYVAHDNDPGWDIFIKMELLTPLTKALGQEIPEEQVIRIGCDLCSALALCAQQKIVHRDIKPANIFVSRSGDYKLGDFGIAKTVEGTSSGTRTGTYDYMSPEVYHDQPYGSAVDLYSLGMVLYWLLNDRRGPFLPLPPAVPGSTDKEQARRRRFQGEAIPPPAHGSPALQQVVLRAIAFDPKNRYQSPEELLAALRSLGKGGSAAAPQKEKNLLWLLIPAALLVIAVAAIALLPHRGASPPTDPTASAVLEAAEQVSAAVSSLTAAPTPTVEPTPTETPAPSPESSSLFQSVFSPGYDFCTGNYSWMEAFQIARERGGHLVCFETREEYDYVLALLDEFGLRDFEFYIGARRDEDGEAYYWVDEENRFFGERLDGPDAWLADLWLEGEPTRHWQDYEETVMELYYSTVAEAWVLNDISAVATTPTIREHFGLIVEFERDYERE